MMANVDAIIVLSSMTCGSMSSYDEAHPADEK